MLLQIDGAMRGMPRLQGERNANSGSSGHSRQEAATFDPCFPGRDPKHGDEPAAAARCSPVPPVSIAACGTALRGAASKLRGPLPWRPRLQLQTSSYSSCVVEAVWLFLLLLESGSSASSCSRQNRQAHPSAEGCAAADAPQVAEVFGGAGVVEGDADDGVERDDHGHNEEGCSRRASGAKPPARQKVTWRRVKRSRQGDVAARP